MAFRADTLRQANHLRVVVGTEADQATRDLTRAWVRSWSTLAPDLRATLAEVADLAVRLGRWPRPWELARITRLAGTLTATRQALAQLSHRTGVTVTDAAGRAIQATTEAEPRLIASPLPAAEQAAAAARFAAKLHPSALDFIVTRTAGRITAASLPLSAAADEAIRRELVRGIAVGSSPRTVARDTLAGVQGAFNGGLTRALNIARTEILDAYRATSGAVHTANSDVVVGWRWLCEMARNSCPACWALHGTEHPLSEPGPMGHPSCRCSRVPITKTWRQLGIDLNEPPDAFPDARARFGALPEADQVAVMGRARLELLRSGAVGWDDLAVRRSNPGWRDSYVPTPVRSLARSAVRSAA